MSLIKDLRPLALYYYDMGMLDENNPKPSSAEILARFDANSQLARDIARKSEDERRFMGHCAFVKICGDGLGLLVSQGYKQILELREKELALQFSRNAIVVTQKIQQSSFKPASETILACASVLNNTALLMPTYFYENGGIRQFTWKCQYDLKAADIALARQETNRVDRLLTAGFERGRIPEDIADMLAYELFLPEYRAEVRMPVPTLKRPKL